MPQSPFFKVAIKHQGDVITREFNAQNIASVGFRIGQEKGNIQFTVNYIDGTSEVITVEESFEGNNPVKTGRNQDGFNAFVSELKNSVEENDHVQLYQNEQDPSLIMAVRKNAMKSLDILPNGNRFKLLGQDSPITARAVTPEAAEQWNLHI